MTSTLVAFDCDGVLVDTEPVVNRVFLKLVARGGPVLDMEQTLARFTGVSMAERVARIRAEYGWEPPPRFGEEFDELQREAFVTELRAVPGAAAVVRAVRSRRAVVSNGSRAEMTLKLDRVKLLDAFAPNLFSAEEVPRSKPFPDVYLRATSALGVSPFEAIAVEDSIPGVRAAVAAGLTVFGYAAATGAEALRAHGARPFHHMAELPDLLRAQGVDVSP